MVPVSFYLAVICSMLSQTPAYLESGVSQYLKLIWIIPLILLVFTNPKAFLSPKLKFFYVFVIAFFTYCMVLQCVTDREYMGADLYNIAISLMVTVVSFAFWSKYGTKRKLTILVIILLLSGIYLAVTVYTQFLAMSSLSELKYAFDAKNSMGQILLNVVIVTITCYMPQKKYLLIPIIILLCVMVVIIFMLKARATICGGIFVLCYYILKYNNRSVRFFIASLTICGCIYIMLDPDAYKVVVEQIILGNRTASSLDDLSSGRIYSIYKLIPLIFEYPFWGSGNRYMDCFPLIIVVQYGIVGSIIIGSFIVKCARIIAFYFRPKVTYFLAAFLLFWTALINSLFEAQPPFGPGIKMFLLWMCFGFALAKLDRVRGAKLSF